MRGKPLSAPHAGALSRAFGWTVVALRILVVGGWIAGAVAATLWLPQLHRSQGSALSDLVAKDSEALRAEARSTQLFGAPITPDTMVVQRDPSGLSQAEQRHAVARALKIDHRGYADLRGVSAAVPILNAAGLVPGSRERSTTAVTYLYFPSRYGFQTRDAYAHIFANRHIPNAEALVGVTGAAPARIAEYDAIQSALPIVGAATAALIALLVGLNFLSPVPALLVLCAGGLSYLVDIRLLGWISERAGISIPSEIEPLLVVLLLGITTDYAIFYLSGQRRRLREGEDPLPAARAVAAQFTPTILVAGLTVAAGTAALLAGKLDFMRAFGPGLALTALVGMVVSITLVPAAIALLGHGLFWPSLGRRPAAEDEETTEGPQRRTLRERVAFWATAKPLAFLIVALCVVALGAAATGLSRLELGFGLVSGLPAGSETARAAKAAGEGFAPGILGPTEVLVERRGVGRDGRALARLQDSIAKQPGVAGVIGPRDEQRIHRHGIAVAGSGDAARYAVILSSDPFEPPAIDRLRALQDKLPALARRAGLGDARIEVGGATALASDTIKAVLGDLWRIAVVVLLVDFLLLAIFLRAVVAPLYLLGASVLALAATLGLTAYVFQGLLGYAGIAYYVPFATAVLLVALGSDYNVFVVGRIWQEARTRPLRDAVATAAPRAARAITVAGLVMAGSFALLGLVPLRAFSELAFAMAVGVLLDSFVVRSFLVPALVSLVGTAGSWPGRRLRTAEELDREQRRGDTTVTLAQPVARR
jgi:RND superfamily putative drug exporter